jgi:lipid-binding SYLF domain-containing protein
MNRILAALLVAGVAPISALANDHEEELKRVTAATTVFNEMMKEGDKGIPKHLLDRAHCVVIIPGLKKAGFIVGGQYGKGPMFCRSVKGGWRGPAMMRVEGGSFGLQIGAGETDLILMVMNEAGSKKLMQSEFKIGGAASVMAGPVGRTTQAETDALMRAEMLAWSRSRGVYAGLTLEGSTLREDKDDNAAIHGKPLGTQDILLGTKLTTPAVAKPLVQALSAQSNWEKP